MDQGALFDRGMDDGAGQTHAQPPRIGPKRLRHAVRNQIEFQECSLDELLPQEHEARIVWEYVCRLDLSPLYQRIQAVEAGPGQAPADPRILVALWLYATLRGVGSARELNRLCVHHAAYRWICGGVSMNYHTLSDFRTQHVELLDRLLTESVASLMAEGGYRPAFNVQLATATDSQVITGVDVTNSGGDQGQLAPMVEQHQQRYEEKPKAALVDGGFVKKADIDQVSPPQGGTKVYAPVMESKDPHRDPHTPRDDDSSAVAEWRQRMSTDEAKAIYRQRAATAECVNALARNRGLQRFLVRGLRKVKAIALWYALAHNLMRGVALRTAAASMAACSG